MGQKTGLQLWICKIQSLFLYIIYSFLCNFTYEQLELQTCKLTFAPPYILSPKYLFFISDLIPGQKESYFCL